VVGDNQMGGDAEEDTAAVHQGREIRTLPKRKDEDAGERKGLYQLRLAPGKKRRQERRTSGLSGEKAAALQRAVGLSSGITGGIKGELFLRLLLSFEIWLRFLPAISLTNFWYREDKISSASRV